MSGNKVPRLEHIVPEIAADLTTGSLARSALLGSLGNWAVIQSNGNVVPTAQVAPSNTGVIALVLNPKVSGIFLVMTTLAFSDGTTAQTVATALWGGQANNGALTGTAVTSAGALYTGANASGSSGGMISANAAGGNGITFNGSNFNTFGGSGGNSYFSSTTPTLTGLLTAQGTGAITFAATVVGMLNPAAAKAAFTVSATNKVFFGCTQTCAGTVTYASASLFAVELPIG